LLLLNTHSARPANPIMGAAEGPTGETPFAAPAAYRRRLAVVGSGRG
jgi:hypothetical protein